MSLKERVQKDIKIALKEKKTDELEALRLFFSAIKNKEIEKKNQNLDSKEVISILRKQIKIYEEASAQLINASRKQEAEKELSKLEFLKNYLPPAMTEEQVIALISQIIKSKKNVSIQDRGLIIKEVQYKTGGSVDNVLIVKLVREQLQQL